MSVKKIVIAPSNTKAIAFFDELAERKEEIFKKMDNMPFLKNMTKKKVK